MGFGSVCYFTMVFCGNRCIMEKGARPKRRKRMKKIVLFEVPQGFKKFSMPADMSEGMPGEMKIPVR